MLTRRWLLVLGMIVAAVGLAPSGFAETGAAALAAPVDPEVLAVREAAWRAWFAGDEAKLRTMLPPEFIGLDMADGQFSGLEKTLADSRAYRAGGGKLVSLEFPETRAQRYGDVVVLYGRYSVVLESEGKQQTFSGRLTEVFVQRDGKWWHPGWHLDVPTVAAAVAKP